MNTKAQQVGEIARLCVELTNSTEHDFMFDYSGRVDRIVICCYLDGYKCGHCSTWFVGFGNPDSYPVIINRLQQFLDGTLEINKENIEAPLMDLKRHSAR